MEAQRAVALLDEAGRARAEHRLDDGLSLALEAAAIFFAVDGPRSADGANSLMAAAEVLLDRSGPGDLADGARRYDEAHAILGPLAGDGGGPLDRLLLRAQRGVGTAARMRGDYAAAGVAFEAALTMAEVAFGPESPEVGFVCNDLGVLGKFSAAFADAERWYARSLAIVEATDGPRSDSAATLHHNLAGLAHSSQRAAEGLESGRLSVEIRRELHGDGAVSVAADRANLGGLLIDVGEVDEAEACFAAALATYERTLGSHHPEVAIAWHNLGAVADRRGDRPRAVELFRRALQLKAAALGPAHPSTLITVVNLGYAVTDDVEACALFRRAIDGLVGTVGADDRTLTAAREGLVERG